MEKLRVHISEPRTDERLAGQWGTARYDSTSNYSVRCCDARACIQIDRPTFVSAAFPHRIPRPPPEEAVSLLNGSLLRKGLRDEK